MKKIIVYIIALFLLLSCNSNRFISDKLHGTFNGVEFYYDEKTNRKHPLWGVKLELKQDGTCVLRKSHSLAGRYCFGEWTMVNEKLVKINCNRNPELDGIAKSLIGGNAIEGKLEVKIINKNKLKLDDVVLKRKK